jgi:hypothetical protein
MNDQDHVRRFLGSLTVGEPLRFKGLALYPIQGGGTSPFACLTLDEAVARGSLHVGEVGAGTVPELLLSNEGDDRVFLLDGEELVGAKQNRILNTSLLVGGRARLTVPVSCVERGRWAFTSGRGMRASHLSHPSLRGEKAAQVRASLRTHGSYASDQAEVWRHVERKLLSLGAVSDSSSLEDGFVRHRESLEEYAARLPCPDGAHGVAAAIAGRAACADLFAVPTLLARLWDKLVASYALDAVDAPRRAAEPPAPAAIARMLSLREDALLEAFAAPGLGANVRVRGDRVTGSALVVDGAVVHAELFASGDGE